MQKNEKQTVVITDYDYGNVDIERAIIEGAGLDLVAAQCKSEDDVIDVARLARARKIRYYDQDTRDGVWRWQSGQPIFRLQGHIMGLLSFGAIARAIARRAS